MNCAVGKGILESEVSGEGQQGPRMTSWPCKGTVVWLLLFSALFYFEKKDDRRQAELVLKASN